MILLVGGLAGRSRAGRHRPSGEDAVFLAGRCPARDRPFSYRAGASLSATRALWPWGLLPGINPLMRKGVRARKAFDVTPLERRRGHGGQRRRMVSLEAKMGPTE